MKVRALLTLCLLLASTAQGWAAPRVGRRPVVQRQLSLCLQDKFANFEPIGDWIDRIRAPILRRFREAFLKNGAVKTAQPNANHDYDRVWGRDSAINSMAYIEAILRGEIRMPDAELVAYLKSRVSFHRARLKAFEEAGLTPGEPLSTENAQVVRHPDGSLVVWARDQNDGPALSATELSFIARILLRMGEADYVRREILDNNPNGVLKIYLEHISHQGITHGIEYLPGQRGAMSVESWEEMFGRGHVYTAMAQYRAFAEASITLQRLSEQVPRGPGARHAQEDYKRTSTWYLLQARKIRGELEKHWIEDTDGKIYVAALRRRAEELEREAARVERSYDIARGLRADAARIRERAAAIEVNPDHPDYPRSERRYFAATIDPEATRTWHFEKTHAVDSLFVVALNHTRIDGGPVIPFQHSDPRVLSTVYVMERQSRRLYGPSSLVDGDTPMQRYVEDTWQGSLEASSGRQTGQYAWTLVTENMATYHYLLRNDLQRAKQLAVDAINIEFLRALSEQGFPALATLKPGDILASTGQKSRLFRQVIEAIERKGDAYLKIVRRTYNADGESSEGFHPISAAPKGPENLTWNWSEWLRAVWARATRAGAPGTPDRH